MAEKGGGRKRCHFEYLSDGDWHLKLDWFWRGKFLRFLAYSIYTSAILRVSSSIAFFYEFVFTIFRRLERNKSFKKFYLGEYISNLDDHIRD